MMHQIQHHPSAHSPAATALPPAHPHDGMAQHGPPPAVDASPQSWAAPLHSLSGAPPPQRNDMMATRTSEHAWALEPVRLHAPPSRAHTSHAAGASWTGASAPGPSSLSTQEYATSFYDSPPHGSRAPWAPSCSSDSALSHGLASSAFSGQPSLGVHQGMSHTSVTLPALHLHKSAFTHPYIRRRSPPRRDHRFVG